MKSVGRLDAVPWLDDPAVRVLFAALDGAGIVARFVGGCVRNSVLGQAIGDYDLAVDTRPELVMQALQAAKVKVVPTGLKHGTVTAVIEGRPFELTTLRRDVETDGRRAVVAFTDDWLEDAGRRDFTFNALYADRDGTLYDPFNGRRDLAEARVRFIGDAEMRIAEDRLRVLRFFRFHAWYGRPPFDAAASKPAGAMPAPCAACRPSVWQRNCCVFWRHPIRPIRLRPWSKRRSSINGCRNAQVLPPCAR